MTISKHKRNRYSQCERTEFVRVWKDSGMTRVAFAHEMNINHKTLCCWIRDFAEEKSKPAPHTSLTPLSLLPLTPTNTHQPAKKSASPAQDIEMLLPNGIRLRFNALYDTRILASFIKEIEQCN